MRIVCCQPAIPYYTWHVEVFINNLRKYYDCEIDIVCAGECLDGWNNLQKLDANFFFYPDLRKDKSYIPSIYFYLMAQHSKVFQGETFWMVDCDIALTKKIDFTPFLQDNIFYLSNTNSYINYDYVVSKGDAQFIEMCKIVGIDPSLVRANNEHSGGGQYLIKGVSSELFEKAELDAVKLYKYLVPREPFYEVKFKGDYPIQKWTAGMWSILWNFWLAGHKTIVHKDLNFIMATNNYKDVKDTAIYHNAGVNPTMQGYFFKGAYMKELPYNLNLKLGDNASKWYYEQIQEVEQKTLLY